MRLMTLLLALTLLPLGGSAKERHTHAEQASITVYSAVPADYWRVATIVGQYQAAGVQVVLRQGDVEPCTRLRKHPPRADITLCERDEPSPYNSVGKTTFGPDVPTIIYLTRASDLAISQGAGGELNTVCHELMHALTHIPDHDAEHADSCVWGQLDHLGDFDIQYLQHHLIRP